jgi:hypothetical protein
MLLSVKDKSLSVFLTNGYVLNDQVRAECCESCKSTYDVLTINYNNPNLMLYGCKSTKCKHRLLRLDFNKESQQMFAIPSFEEKHHSLT